MMQEYLTSAGNEQTLHDEEEYEKERAAADATRRRVRRLRPGMFGAHSVILAHAAADSVRFNRVGRAIRR